MYKRCQNLQCFWVAVYRLQYCLSSIFLTNLCILLFVLLYCCYSSVLLYFGYILLLQVVFDVVSSLGQLVCLFFCVYYGLHCISHNEISSVLLLLVWLLLFYLVLFAASTLFVKSSFPVWLAIISLNIVT